MEIPERAFAKVSIDLIVSLTTSHYGSKNILVMVDHLTGWPIAKVIPGKEATTVVNTILRSLCFSMVHLKFFCLRMARNSIMILWPMCVKSSILNNILHALIHLGQIATLKISTNFQKLL